MEFALELSAEEEGAGGTLEDRLEWARGRREAGNPILREHLPPAAPQLSAAATAQAGMQAAMAGLQQQADEAETEEERRGFLQQLSDLADLAMPALRQIGQALGQAYLQQLAARERKVQEELAQLEGSASGLRSSLAQTLQDRMTNGTLSWDLLNNVARSNSALKRYRMTDDEGFLRLPSISSWFGPNNRRNDLFVLTIGNQKIVFGQPKNTGWGPPGYDNFRILGVFSALTSDEALVDMVANQRAGGHLNHSLNAWYNHLNPVLMTSMHFDEGNYGEAAISFAESVLMGMQFLRAVRGARGVAKLILAGEAGVAGVKAGQATYYWSIDETDLAKEKAFDALFSLFFTGLEGAQAFKQMDAFDEAISLKKLELESVGAEARRWAGAAGDGAYGFWPRLDEAADPDVLNQLHKNACGPTAVAMIARDLGADVSRSQAAALAGRVLSWGADGLQSALQKLTGLSWNQALKNTTTVASMRQSLSEIVSNGPAMIRVFVRGQPSAHWLVVDGIDDAGRAIIRDPSTGTRYMSQFHNLCKIVYRQAK